ncbi:putative coil containing protein [Vibrio phage 249E41-1]|nr:putative coil containing protein [Vibrio phage 249E41-1]CAH9017530.1 putative coil containing protein [Vibrio phage 193E37-1]
MSNKINIKLDDGKYEYTFENGTQIIKRNGEQWRDETGDNFLLSMAMRIEELEWKLETGEEEAIQIIQDVVSKNPQLVIAV